MVDVIPALPPVVSHWHLVRQLRPTLEPLTAGRRRGCANYILVGNRLMA